MRRIAVYNNKGGVGKTTTAVNLAFNLADKGYRVLLADMDSQGNATSFFRRYDLNRVSCADALGGRTSVARVIKRTSYGRLDIVPSNQKLMEIQIVRPVHEMLEPVEDRYDFCVIDCPPAAGREVQSIMDAVEQVIIPIRPGLFAKEGLSTVLDIVANGRPGIEAGCLFTMFYKNKNALKLIQEIVNTYDCTVYENVIRRSVHVEYSESKKKPLKKCASKSPVCMDYMDFTEEFLRRIGSWQC